MLLKCHRCGEELIIGGNDMLSDIEGVELTDDEDAIVTNASCPFCGLQYTIVDTPESEKENYDYWNNSY